MPESTPAPPTPETEYEQLIHTLAQLRADARRLEKEARDDEVPFDVQSAIMFLSSDIETVIVDVVDYIEGVEEMPDECPVCGEAVVEADELDPGESYAVEKLCIEEQTPGGPGHGILHFARESDA